MKQTGIKIILLSIVILLIYICIFGVAGYDYFPAPLREKSSIVVSIICGFIALVGLLWHDKKKDD